MLVAVGLLGPPSCASKSHLELPKQGPSLVLGGSWEQQQLNQSLSNTHGAKPCRGGLSCPRAKGFYPSFAGANANWMLWQLSPAAGEC